MILKLGPMPSGWERGGRKMLQRNYPVPWPVSIASYGEEAPTEAVREMPAGATGGGECLRLSGWVQLLSRLSSLWFSNYVRRVTLQKERTASRREQPLPRNLMRGQLVSIRTPGSACHKLNRASRYQWDSVGAGAKRQTGSAGVRSIISFPSSPSLSDGPTEV